MAETLLPSGSPKSVFKNVLNRSNQAAQQNAVMPNYGGGAEKCARCLKSVYLAEKKTGAGRSFHSSCFSCKTCNRKLDASTLSEHKGEIYCKTCYTRQFGVHGLVSGVTMSTEHPVHEPRHSRRSSYGSELDAPVITHQKVRQRAHSNDNVLRGEHGPTLNDELPKMFPWKNDVIPEPIKSPPSASTAKSELEELIEKNRQQRPKSQIGFEKITGTTNIETDYDYPPRQSVLLGEDDRQNYIKDGEKLSYKAGASALVEMPVVSPGKRTDSYIDRIEMPTVPTKLADRTSNPSPSSPSPLDQYRRQNSREYQTDLTGNVSRLTLNENQRDPLGRQQSNNMTTNIIASENPLLRQTSSNYETNHFTVTTTTTTTTNNNNGSNTQRETTYHSRDSSPSTVNQRTSSSTSGYVSPNVHSDTNTRGSTSPPSAYVPQHEYLNTQLSPSNSQTVNRRPSSPQSTERTPSVMDDFVSKTNPIARGPSPSGTGKYSTLAALVQPHRPLSQHNYSDDEFDN